MDLLARKFARAKWEVKPFMESHEVAADAVTGCLRTTDNTLSLWLCTEDQRSIEEVVLAMAASLDRLEKMHVITLPKTEIESEGLSLELSEGKTPVAELRNRHVDIFELTLEDLASIATLMAAKIRGDIGCHLFTKGDVLRIIRKAVIEGRVRLVSLREQVRKQVEASGLRET